MYLFLNIFEFRQFTLQTFWLLPSVSLITTLQFEALTSIISAC